MYETRRRRPPQLSERDRAVLAIERKWGPGPDLQAQKHAQAARELDLSPTGYSLVLRALLEDPVAMAHDPTTITALRAVRDSHVAGGDVLPAWQAGYPAFVDGPSAATASETTYPRRRR